MKFSRIIKQLQLVISNGNYGSRSMLIGVLTLMAFIITTCGSDDNPTDADSEQMESLGTWIYRDSTYTMVSGVVDRRRSFIGEKLNGITVWISDQKISCLDSPGLNSHLTGLNGGWFSVSFPGISIKDYSKLEIQGTMAFSGENGSLMSGNLGEAGLTLADTTEEKRVKGWMDFEQIGLFEEGEVSRASFSFDLPFCSADLDPTYIPNDPVSTWSLNGEIYSAISVISESRDTEYGGSKDGISIILTDSPVTCDDSPFNLTTGSSVSIEFPEISERTYNKDEIKLIVQSVSGGGISLGFLSGTTLRAGLTSVDTSGNRQVQGWVAAENLNEPNNFTIFGSFDATFCSNN